MPVPGGSFAGSPSAAQAAVAGIAERPVRALAKVVQVMPPRLRRKLPARGRRGLRVGGAFRGG